MDWKRRRNGACASMFMFNLEQAISEWRARMAAGGIKSPAVLDELENHLREEIRARVKAGATDDQAFGEAGARMGTADSLRDEFRKIHPGGRFFTWSLFLWLGLAGLMAVYCGRRWIDGRMGLLLATHIFTLTMGYLAAFVAGGIAAAYVYAQWTGETSSTLKCRLASGISRFIDLAAALVLIGFVLGLLWSERHYGRYWVKDVREIGALVGMTGMLVLSIARRLRLLSEETQVLLGLGGSLVAGLAWFGTLVVAHNQILFSWWPLDVFIAFHLFLAALTFARRQKPVIS
jgi:hypothetical protein